MPPPPERDTPLPPSDDSQRGGRQKSRRMAELVQKAMQFARGPAASRTQSQCARTQKSVNRLVKCGGRRTLVQEDTRGGKN